MPFRVETRFQLQRWRDLVPFLADALGLVAEFRRSDGAYGMWLKGRLWKLEFGSYSEWVDEPAMRRFAAGPSHRRALKRSHGDWPGESWTIYDGGSPAWYQRCAGCGVTHRGPARSPHCPHCQAVMAARVEPPPARPSRGIPISPRIAAGRAVRERVLGPDDAPTCQRCGFTNPAQTVYCLRCGSRTYRAMNFVSRFGWGALVAFAAFGVIALIVIGVYLSSRWV